METRENFRVSQETDDRVTRLAKDWKISKSWVLRYLLETGLDLAERPPSLPPEEHVIRDFKPKWKL